MSKITPFILLIISIGLIAVVALGVDEYMERATGAIEAVAFELGQDMAARRCP